MTEMLRALGASAAGASFAVAPGLNPETAAEAEKIGLPFVPGVATPTEIERALALGCKVLKFFPAEASGGGARAIVLTNQKGAVLELSGRQVGLMANADLSGLAITLR